jgi:outer membrane PBP1 activator LpoA protein
MTQTTSRMGEAEAMLRRQAEMGGWGERAAESIDRLFNGQLAGTQSEVVNLVVRTMSEQARQNVEFALDLMGTRGPERMMQCQSHYWTDTMARAQRFQKDMLALTQQAAGATGDKRR